MPAPQDSSLTSKGTSAMSGTSFRPTPGQFASIVSSFVYQLPYAIGDYDSRVITNALKSNGHTLGPVLRDAVRDFIRQTYLLAFVRKWDLNRFVTNRQTIVFNRSVPLPDPCHRHKLLGGLKWPKTERFYLGEYEVQERSERGNVLETVQQQLRFPSSTRCSLPFR